MTNQSREQRQSARSSNARVHLPGQGPGLAGTIYPAEGSLSPKFLIAQQGVLLWRSATLLGTQLLRWNPMPKLGCRTRGIARSALAFTLLFCSVVPTVSAQVLLFSEDFNGLPLGPPADEPLTGFPNAFTHTPPPGWDRDDSGVPGVGDPLVGVEEWEGWSFANKNFWQTAATLGGGPTPRDFFTRGQGTIAVADPDQWNDLGDPANAPNGGFYSTLLETPFIDLTPATLPGFRVKLGFDSSWFGGDCCNDGANFTLPNQPEPGSDNQTAFINVRYDNGQVDQILRWEAAPYLDQQGDPTNDPGPPGTPNSPNPHFRPPEFNERVWIELDLPQAAALGLISSGDGPAASTASGASLEFGLENAGDDGWWGIDNLQMFSVSTVLGDMNVDDVVDSADIAAFALGLINEDEYANTYYGEFPVTRGSSDGTFDLDDIEWFVNILETSGVATSVEEVIAAAFSPAVPEPCACGAALLALSLIVPNRRRP